ncbi:MAG: DUF4236 domain-containing protein [Chloroflexi bacterium]|nr:DUF4236 domain-containing protein [Chloroflexota bacterium]
MPFRFRKSLKLGKGFKINLSKSGLSTSIGGKGLSLNLGKRGVRSTVGIPGTGLSFSKLLSTKTSRLPAAKVIDQPDAPSDYQPVTSSPISKAIRKPKIKIPFGCVIPVALIAMCWQIVFCSALVSEIINPSPTSTPAPSPTFTQLPTSTSLPTQTSLPTDTPLPSETSTLFPTNTPFITETLPANCLASYPSFCILPGQRIACDQLPSNFVVLPPDPLGYDGDGDGYGCEK